MKSSSSISATPTIFSTLLRLLRIFSFPSELAVEDGFVYVIDRGTKLLQIFDFTNPFFPAALDFDKTKMGVPRDIAVQDGFAYVADEAFNGMQIFDVSNPNLIVPRWFIDTGLVDPNDIAVQGGNAFITDQGTDMLHVIDVSNPDAPVMGDANGTGLTFPADVAVAGDFVYTLDGGTGDLLQVYSFTPRVLVNEDLQLAGGLIDTDGAGGAPGEVLVSTTTGPRWLAPPSDGDSSTTNELQTLGLSGASVSIGPSGNSISLAGIGQSLANGTIPGSKLATNSIGATKLMSNSVNATHLATNSVASSELADNAVTPTKIASNAVNPGHINQFQDFTFGHDITIGDADVTADNGINFGIGIIRLFYDFSEGRFQFTSAVAAPGFLNTSDRNKKEAFAKIDPAEVLEKVDALDLTTWSFKQDDPSVRHLGPMAQDFHAAFGLGGDDDRHISTLDASGVALAAIQALKSENDETEE